MSPCAGRPVCVPCPCPCTSLPRRPASLKSPHRAPQGVRTQRGVEVLACSVISLSLSLYGNITRNKCTNRTISRFSASFDARFARVRFSARLHNPARLSLASTPYSENVESFASDKPAASSHDHLRPAFSKTLFKVPWRTVAATPLHAPKVVALWLRVHTVSACGSHSPHAAGRRLAAQTGGLLIR